MVSRSLVILVCVSLIGVTVLPASLLPCCCKFERATVFRESPGSACPLHNVNEPVSNGPTARRSCCSAVSIQDRASTATCCFPKVLKEPCGKCRCLEQMQIVALSGYSPPQLPTKILLVAHAPVAASSFASRYTLLVQVADAYPPTLVVILKTCTLLI